MAATSVEIKLGLPYQFRAEEMEQLERAGRLEKFPRELSEQFIIRALTAQHGAELDRKTARMWGRIQREINTGADPITLDGTQAEWFFDLFLSAKAEEQTKIRPEHAVFWFQWCDALDEVRQAAKAATP